MSSMQPLLETAVKQRFGELEMMEQVRDDWWIGRTADTIVTWPVPAVGSRFEPMDEILGQLILLRRDYPDLACSVVLPTSLASHRSQLLLKVEDLRLAFSWADPTIELLVLDGVEISPLSSRPALEPVPVQGIPGPFQRLVDQVFGSLASPEYVCYRDSFFAEYLGIPVLGMVGEALVVGVDPRDQAMARETAMTSEALLSFAHEIVETLVASRLKRSGRYDFSRVAVGRLLRSLYIPHRAGIIPLEYGEVGQARARAYASGGGTFYGFGSALDLWLIVETAVLCQPEGEASQVVYVLDQEPLSIFAELARLVCIPYSIEVKELTGG
ncbi:hypothetical protein [Ferrimicrobium acidiphilum]|uniref:hypothetical protein n=2 Tax=Ferrimicrobium acidiphilum TaxID=121039 RepID=UPI0023F17E6D|nr:hypothetical protein [Ferrimicrobium acidiphilum]